MLLRWGMAVSSPDRIGIPALGVAVIGAGAMGLSLAAMLGRELPVTIVVRDAGQAAVMRRNGAVVRGLLRGASHPRIVASCNMLVQHAPYDAVFVATKTTAIGAVADELRPILHELAGPTARPCIVSFQNGIESGRELMERLACSRVLRMVLNFGASRKTANTAEVMLNSPPHFIGSPHPDDLPAARALAAVLTGSGLQTCATEQIETHVWEKGVLNASMNPVAALTDSSIGEVLDSPARAIVDSLMREGLAVAHAEGVGLDPAIAERMWAVLESARRHTPSMVGDIRSGRQSEIGQLNRQIIAHALRIGVPVPSHEIIASLIDSFDWRVFLRHEMDCVPGPTVHRPGFVGAHGRTLDS